MPYKIISPTGATVTKTLSEEEVEKLKRDGYFNLEPQVNSLDDFFANEKPVLRIHKNINECESCHA